MGTSLLVTDYGGLAAECQQWARAPGCLAVEFANTQIITLRRHDPAFRELTSAYDFLLPDGMPLVWCLNRAGAGMRDRVYGPTFMRKFLETVPAGFTHYLLGGSPECGEKLREVFGRVNPGIQFIGAFHGKCNSEGVLEGVAETAVIEEINRLSPDFIWVGLGAPKQQAWTMRHKHLIRRGVILTVGFGFDVNAGLKPDAPAWMQTVRGDVDFPVVFGTAAAGAALLQIQFSIPLLSVVRRLAGAGMGARRLTGVERADPDNRG